MYHIIEVSHFCSSYFLVLRSIKKYIKIKFFFCIFFTPFDFVKKNVLTLTCMYRRCLNDRFKVSDNVQIQCALVSIEVHESKIFQNCLYILYTFYILLPHLLHFLCFFFISFSFVLCCTFISVGMRYQKAI